MRARVAIVGAGRVGQTLGRALQKENIAIGAVVTRSMRSARKAVGFVGAGTPYGGITEKILAANLIIVGVPDPEIAPIAKALARYRNAWKGKIVLHLSGSRSSQELEPLKRLGGHCGSLHPLLPVPRRLDCLPRPMFYAIEGDRLAVVWGKRIARALGGEPVVIKAKDKVLYHAAAALVGGHLMALVEVGKCMLTKAGLSPRTARSAILSPIPRTLAQYGRFGEAAWTGPLARGDFETVARHLASLGPLPPLFAESYKVLGRAALALFAGPNARTAPQLAKLLAQPKH